MHRSDWDYDPTSDPNTLPRFCQFTFTIYVEIALHAQPIAGLLGPHPVCDRAGRGDPTRASPLRPRDSPMLESTLGAGIVASGYRRNRRLRAIPCQQY